MKKIPLYFNFVGSQKDLLERAMESYDRVAGDIIDVRVHYSYRPRKFTTCLNEILKMNDEPYFFAHYDSVLEDRSAVEGILNFERADNIAIVGHTHIVDLLMLVVPNVVRKVGGWDENFSNSWMDLDLYNRLNAAGLGHSIVNPDIAQGRGVDHSKASTARVDPILGKVYAKTMLEDTNTYFDRYASRAHPEYIRMRQHIRDAFGV